MNVAAKIERRTLQTVARLTSVWGFSRIGFVLFSHCGKQTTFLNQLLITNYGSQPIIGR